MKVRLGDYIQEYSVRNKLDEDIPVYSVTNSKGFCQDYFGKEVASKDKSTYKIVPQGCFAYNPSRINVGSVDWQRNRDRVIVSPLYNVFSVSPDLDQQYLYYYLKSDITLHFIKEIATGSVRDNLRLEMLYEFPINLPGLGMQRQIVARLDMLSNIIGLYKEQLDQLDTLIKARFVEMFGDPSTNPMGWEQLDIGQLMTVEPQNGLYKPQTDYVPEGGAPILRIDAFYGGKVLSFEKLKRLKCSEEEIQRYSLCEDDIVVNRVNSLEYLGKCAHISGLNEPTVYESNMMRFHLDDGRISAVFATHMLCSEFVYHQILKRAKKAVNQASINQGDVKSICMPVPPLNLQNQFVAFVSEVDKSKAVVQKALDEAQLLFDSLMQEYFG